MNNMTFIGHHQQVLSNFSNAAKNAEVASFDIFDTLLVRCFERPTDLFLAMAALISQKDFLAGETFAQERIDAEVRARNLANQSNRNEITLQEIYNELCIRWPSENAKKDFEINEIMDLECEMEVAAVRADDQVKNVFDSLVSDGKRVILVSDMYLPLTCIEAMLKKCKIAGYEKLFLSNVESASKCNGTIWPVARLKLQLTLMCKIVHLGDNEGADGSAAAIQGVIPFLLVAPSARTIVDSKKQGNGSWFENSFTALLRQSYVAHRTTLDRDYYWLKIAHSIVIPAVIGMAIFIKKIAKTEEIDKIFFLARDGLIFQKAFQIIWEELDVKTSEYIWSSRRCLNIAMIETLTEVDIDFLVSGSALLSVQEYIKRIDIDIEDPDIRMIVNSHFSSVIDIIKTDIDRAKLRSMFRGLEKFICSRAKVERLALLTHLNQTGLFQTNALVVDLGWHGSLQRSLSIIGQQNSDKQLKLIGAYLGLIPPVFSMAGNVPMRTFGWLFDENGPKDAIEVILRSVGIVEILFSAPEGSIRHVENRNGQICPVRISDPAESERLRIAALIHGEVERACASLAPFVNLISQDELKKITLKNLKTLLAEPKAEDLKEFGRLTHAEGFGTGRFSSIIPSVSSGTRRWDLYQNYIDAFWPTGFLATMSLKNRIILKLTLKDKKYRSRMFGNNRKNLKQRLNHLFSRG